MTASTSPADASVVAVARAVARRARDERVTLLAAGVAYYAFVSLVPLSLLALSVASFVGGDEFASFVVDQVDTVLAPSGRDLVRETIVDASGRNEATLISLAFLLWSGLKLFRGLDAAFSEVYGVAVVESAVGQIVDALVVLASIGLAAVAAVVVGGVLPTLPAVPVPGLVAPVSLTLALFAVFFPIYYVFPDTDPTLREVIPGTALAAVGWTVLTEGFRIYAANAGQFELYGLLGGVLLLVTWFYVAAILIILGAILNAVLAGRTGDDDDAGESDDGGGEGTDEPDETPSPAPDITALDREVRALRERLDERTVDRSTLEAELKQYVRQRARRGHARGWGPYLVLLYGTGMTLGAFFFLRGGWAILAMIVVWLSTLGLYVLMLLVGATFGVVGLPGRVADRVRRWRS